MAHTKTVVVQVETKEFKKEVTLEVPFPTSFSDLEILIRENLEASTPGFTFETPADFEILSVC